MIRNLGILSTLLSAALALSACTALDDMNDIGIGGKGFNHYLYNEYRSLAVFEAEQMYDRADADYYAGKALKADAGVFVEPTLLREREIAPEFLPEMAHARSELVTVLLTQNEEKARWRDLAVAQTSFDCWLEQQEEGIQPEHIQNCRDNFYSAMDRLLGQLVLEEAFMVFFEHEKADLDTTARGNLVTVARVLKDNPDLHAVLTGNADTTGGEGYNDGLALRRAKAVEAALKAEGVEPSRLSLYSEGERNLLVQTPDNVREQKNRRVDILVKVGKN